MNHDRHGHRGAEEDENDAHSPRDDGAAPMKDAPVVLPTPPARVAPHAYRTALLEMVEPVVAEISAAVPAYRGRVGGRRHQLMSMATSAAIRAYLDTSPQQVSARRKVDELFHRMGWGEAQDGHGPENLDLALQVATRAVWRRLADYAVLRGYSAEGLRDETDALVAYIAHLRAELLAGHRMWQRDPYYDGDQARTRLWELLSPGTTGRISPLQPLGVESATLIELAQQAQWPVPERVVAIAVSFHGPPPPPPQSEAVLSSLELDRLLVLCPAEAEDELISELAGSATDRRVVVSWPVAPEESGTALLWTLRALDLVQLGAIPPTSVVRCSEHTTQLWLHAEPSMRRHLCQDLLEPLLAESPNSREILSATLLTWLETRDSAPAIAARLDVHPQTVRYRWRRINELFGEALHDPEFVVQMTLVLKSSLPLWKGGDQSDFKLFRDAKEPEL